MSDDPPELKDLGENLRSDENINARTEWVQEQLVDAGRENGILPTGGSETSQIWLETRNAYSLGLFISAVILGAGVIEHVLGQQLSLYTDEYEHGERLPSLNTANKKARKHGLISEDEYEKIREVRKLRNSYVHHRYGFEDHSPAARREEERLPGREHPNLIGKEDAETVIPICIRICNRAWKNFDEQVKGEDPDSSV